MHGVGLEDICKARCDDATNTEVVASSMSVKHMKQDTEISHSQTPGSVFSGTTASKVLAGAHEDFGLVIRRAIQDEVRVFTSVRVLAKGEEESVS